MKIMSFSEVSQNELNILVKIVHENVVKYLDHFELVLRRNLGTNERSICIVMEYCEVLFLKTLFYLVN